MRLNIQKFAPRSGNHMWLFSVGAWLPEIHSATVKPILSISYLYITLKSLTFSEIVKLLISHPERLETLSTKTIKTLSDNVIYHGINLMD
jgi:hypothetical protein